MISIIVPIYNVAPYLRRCIDSILNQTYHEFELILVDDGSPDNCGAICDEYAAKDTRVRVIHKENGGLSNARNAGCEIAQGEFIAFIDSDDWIAPDFLKRLYTTLEVTRADICECGVIKTDGKTDLLPVRDEVPSLYNTVDALEQLIHDGAFHQHVWNKLYRRDVIADIIFPKGKTNEDEFWTYQVFGNAKTVAKISDVLYFYFQRPGSIMGETYSLKRLDALEAKLERQAYLDAKFPQPSSQARLNLFGSCIYAAQMSLVHLSKEHKVVAKERINTIVRQCSISLRDCLRVGGSNKLWFSLAKLSFWSTCKFKNFLRRGF